MSNTDLAVIQYLKLAKLSRAKEQLGGCDRFLILAGVAACRAGWLDVAGVCRTRVLKHNAHHMLSRWDTLPNALRSEEFSAFFRQLERFCSVERAETLLNELDQNVILHEESSTKDLACEQLDDPVWDS